MRKTAIISAILLAFAVSAVQAKVPKWYKKSRNAICQIIAYNEKGDETGRTTGFFTSADGCGITGYDILASASTAVAVDANGNSYNILYVIGANRIYDVARFKINAAKPLPYLTIAENGSQEQETLYLVQYSTDRNYTPQAGTIAKCSGMTDNYTYYTLSCGDVCRNASGAPLMDMNGNVAGILQNQIETDTCNYAVDSRYALSLAITTALTLNNDDYRGMTFPKALPDNEDQALVYLYINQSSDSKTYEALLERFISQYPESPDGYMRKAIYLTGSGDSLKFEEGRKALDKSYALSDDKAGSSYEYARLIYASLTEAGMKTHEGWDLEEALNKINDAINISREPLYIQLRGNILYAMQKYPDALSDYQELCRTSLASPDAYYYSSVTKQKMEMDADEIIATLDSAVNFYGRPYTSKVAPFILERATIKEGLQRYREAVLDLNEYEQILSSANLTAEFYYFREQIEVKAKMYEQALKDIDRAVYLSPQDFGLYLEYASLLMRVGMSDQAKPLLEKLTEQVPDNNDCHRLLGICLMNNDENEQARIHFQKAVELGDEQAAKLLERLNK